MTEEGIYRERVFWPSWFYFTLVLGFAVAVVGIAGVVRREGLAWPVVVLALPIPVVAFVFWRLRFLELEFGAHGAAFGFGGVRRRVPRARIQSAEVIAYPAARYMGWGYRLGWEVRERAQSVLGCRRGVRLVFEDEHGRSWKVFLSSRDPEAAVRALDA